ncbi:MAG: hypothetical protein QOJ21_54 [Solirubrobacteraceae bacterium]|nr:hypothetical protein [Solirubrobacteraceae bacterium]
MPPDALRLLLGAFGDPGHAFPMIALGRALRRRGHEVVLQTWRRWRELVEAEGMRFEAAPEYQVFPTADTSLTPYEAVARATADTRPLVASLRPDAVIADILTLAPALAGEIEGVPVATLIPHVDPRVADGFPPFSIGARLPRTAAGRALWRSVDRGVDVGLARGRAELNAVRVQLGLPALSSVHGGISRELCLVATFPQLEYPRVWPARTHVVGPMLWEPPAAEVPLPPGDGPLVLVAPSTSQDRSCRLVRAALEGLARLPVRVLVAGVREAPDPPLAVPANARVVEWASYARTMPGCDVVLCHGGHGTVARALASGCVVVCVPAGGDMNENAARVDWAGVGVRLPRRLCTPWAVRLAVQRALGEPRLARRAAELAVWAAGRDAGLQAARRVEELVAERR